MKNYLLFLLIFISACSASKKPVSSADTNSELIYAKEKVPGITRDQLTLGRKIYIRDCTSCHALKDPAHYTPLQWTPILKRMFPKAKISDSTTIKLITDYVIAKSK